MANGQTSVPGALQMTDEELQLEQARGRMIGLTSVLTVALLSGFILATYFALRDSSGGNQAAQLKAIYEHKLAYTLSGFFFAVGSLLIAGVLTHIILAARSRSSVVPKFALYVAIAGPVLVALAYPVFTFAQVSAANDFADAAVHTNAVAKDLVDSGLGQGATAVFRFGLLLVAVAWVMVGIYGMRLGLLTRLVGAVAIAIGAANVLAAPLAALLSIFWIGAMAITLLGESAQTPPAWKLGRPVTWREVAAAAHAPGEDPSDFNKSEQ